MSGFLFDTNVISETRKRAPNERVMKFISVVPRDQFFTSAIAIAEMRLGAARKSLIDPEEGNRISVWIDGLERRLKERILVVDSRVAFIYAQLQMHRDHPIMDALLAATALAHELIVVTRNVRDFAQMDVEIFNPWDSDVK